MCYSTDWRDGNDNQQLSWARKKRCSSLVNKEAETWKKIGLRYMLLEPEFAYNS